VIDAYLRPWSGEGVRHLPEQARDPLDVRWAGIATENRWNVAGQPTLYLAKDRAVALAELARHFRDERTPELARQAHQRQVYRFRLTLHRTLDLRDPAFCAALSITDAPQRVLHKPAARATAQFLRELTPAEALFVPSMAFLDQPEAWVLVVFLEKLPADLRSVIAGVTPDRLLAIEP
jgi:RES domain-containing protein